MKRLLPAAMLKRWPPMLIWLVALGYTSYGAPELATTTAMLGIVGVGFTLLLYVLWGPRTRPRRGAFWFLVHVVILGAVIALAGAKPVLAAVVAVPVALLWIHDSPASPTAMLSWGVLMVLWPPDFWSSADAAVAWDVMFTVVLVVAASQFERNRLAARHHTQSGIVFSLLRLLAVLGLSMLFVAGREGLRAVNVFTYLGIDASGIAGKITMLSIVAVSLAVAVALFRVRPERPPVVVEAQAPRPAKGQRVDPRQGAIDFDEPSDRTTRRATDKAVERRQTGARPGATKRDARPAAREGPRPRDPAPVRRDQGPAQPGELDFD